MLVHARLGCVFAALFALGVSLGWFIFPALLKSQLKKEKALSSAPPTNMRLLWERIPFPLDTKLYLFNYTNPVEVGGGARPKVQELGPYYFEEWKSKVVIEDDEASDTVSYRSLDLFFFDDGKSGDGLTGEEVITMPNILMLSIPQAVLRERPSQLKTVAKSLPLIFRDHYAVLMQVPVMDILFRGVPFDCSNTAFAAKAVCAALKKEKSIKVLDDKVYFSIFGKRNGTVDPRVVTVRRGTRNVTQVGQVVSVDGTTEGHAWRDGCNTIRGTDGTVFPPFFTSDQYLETYSVDLKRSFKLKFVRKNKYKKLKTSRYEVEIGDLSDPTLLCFCPTDDTCPKRGLMDLFKTGMGPLYISTPHFLDCDESLLDGVEGLNPEWDAHGLFLDFEPLSGTPLLAKHRVMFSIELMRIQDVPLMGELPGTIAPLFWIEQTLALNDTFVSTLRAQLFRPIRVVKVLSWLLILSGLLGALSALGYHHNVYKPAEESRMRDRMSAEKSHPVFVRPSEPPPPTPVLQVDSISKSSDL